jgi:hypothetical protein
MDILHERVPLLVRQAHVRAPDRGAVRRSLISAEQHLRSFGEPKRKDRQLRNQRAAEIARAWFSITGSTREADRSLQTCIGYEGDIDAWTATALAFRCALGLKQDDRSL